MTLAKKWEQQEILVFPDDPDIGYDFEYRWEMVWDYDRMDAEEYAEYVKQTLRWGGDWKYNHPTLCEANGYLESIWDAEIAHLPPEQQLGVVNAHLAARYPKPHPPYEEVDINKLLDELELARST